MKTAPLFNFVLGGFGACALLVLGESRAEDKTDSGSSSGVKTSTAAPVKVGQKPVGAVEKPAESGGSAAKEDDSRAQDSKGEASKIREAGRPAARDMESLRLNVGVGGLRLGEDEDGGSAPSGGTSLGPLPDFKALKPSGEGDSALEEPPFPDVEMRRRARPDLLPDGPNPTEEAAVALRDRIRFRSIKTQALRDPAVREALEASVKARSERDRRAALQRHYTLLYSRMRALDGSLQGLISERESDASERLREILPR